MRIFISGGCKNGKSSYAERIAYEMCSHRYYIATMIPADSEDDERIARHIKNREGLCFNTIEISKNIADILKICNTSSSFLVDSLTALLANEMFEDGIFNDVYMKVWKDMQTVISNIPNIVIVSDYIYSDTGLYDDITDKYMAGLAFLDRRCAEKCDVVLEASLGSLIIHKGGDCFEGLYKKII